MRIEIPEDRGRNMLGVMDETGTLEYGQVFVQVSQIGSPMKEVQGLNGRSVVVSRNPCLSSGDVRILEAVDVPALRHLVDVIVFPAKGPRPHPDQLSGGDLDGDEFTVFWLDDLFFKKNESPRNFPKSSSAETSPILVEDMIDFFQDYIQNDRLGQISLNHLFLSDSGGLNSWICRSLADKHNVAVDFPKTGVKPAELSQNERPQAVPDFSRRVHRTKRSKKILGQLYRKVRRVTQLSLAGQRLASEPVQPEPHLLRPNRVKWLAAAISSRNAYNRQLQTLMGQYGVQKEGALVSGNILRLRTIWIGNDDQYEAEKMLQARLEHLWAKTKEAFFSDVGGDQKSLDDEPDLLQLALDKASAWYAVTYDPSIRQPNTTGLLSFPWVVADLLAKVKLNAVQLDPRAEGLLRSPLAQVLGRKISEKNIVDEKLLLSSPPHVKLFLQEYPGFNLLLNFLLHWGSNSNNNQTRSLFLSHYSRTIVCEMILKICQQEELMPSYEDLIENTGNIDEIGTFTVERLGVACICVLRYWASQAFRNQDGFLASFLKQHVPILSYNARRSLHEAAFHAFHSIASSGRFHSLQLDSSDNYIQDDLFEPLSLMEDSFLFLGMQAPTVEQRLKEGTGMSDVVIRVRQEGRTRRWIVGGEGELDARERLRGILQEPEDLQRLLRSKQVIDFDQSYYDLEQT